MQAKRNCVVCGREYETCAYCEQVRTYTPWRVIACSPECYQVYLAYLIWRDNGKNDLLFAETVDRVCADKKPQMPANMLEVYLRGKKVLEDGAGENEQTQAPSPKTIKRKSRAK